MSRNLFALRIWLVMIVIATCLASTPALAQGGAVVRVEPAAASAQVNDRVEVYIKIDNVTNLIGFELHLKFDPNVLEVIDVTNGGFVDGFVAANTFDNATGKIDYAAAKNTPPSASGNGALLIIGFRAKANGRSVVSLQPIQDALLLSDGNGVAIPASWVDGSIAVGQAAALTPTATYTLVTSIPPQTNTPTFTNAPITNTPVTITPIGTSTLTRTPAITPSAPTYTPTRTPTNTDMPEPVRRIHFVRSGETLFCIARAYQVWPWAIAEVNHIWWPYTIYPNQRLRIPDVLWSPIPPGPTCTAQFTPYDSHPHPGVTPPPASTPAVPPLVCRSIYIVRPGDTLYAIAVRYGVSYADIARLNQIPNARLIYSGQRLCIP